MKLRLAQLVAVGALIGLWALVAAAGLLTRELLPPPTDVLRAVVDTGKSGALWSALASTLQGAVYGLALAAVIGVPLGLVIGASPRLDRATRFLVDLGRSFPVIALLPVLILIMGASDRMKTVVVLLACVWPILVQSVYGARRIEPVVADIVRGYRIPWHLRFRRVVLPSAGPFIATGIRVAAAGAVLVSVAVEVLSQTPGLGREIALSQQGGASALSLAYVFYAGCLGVLINAVLWAAEGRLLRWREAVA